MREEALSDSISMMKGKYIAGAFQNTDAKDLSTGYAAGCQASNWMINIFEERRTVYFAAYRAVAGVLNHWTFTDARITDKV